MNADTPKITSALYGSKTSTFDPEEWTGASTSGGSIISAAGWAHDHVIAEKAERAAQRALRRVQAHMDDQSDDPFTDNPSTTETTMPNDKPTRRLVQVFIADPDPNVPLKNALLHRGELTFTDATDQELYFEVPIVELLAKHNAERVKWLDKDATRKAGKDVFLEPVRVRDLRMVVVNVASF